jgi:hypothetical protein
MQQLERGTELAANEVKQVNTQTKWEQDYSASAHGLGTDVSLCYTKGVKHEH